MFTLPVEQVFRFEIADKNDNSPKFEKDKYTAVIAESTAVNSTVTVVKATDADSGIDTFFIFFFGKMRQYFV